MNLYQRRGTMALRLMLGAALLGYAVVAQAAKPELQEAFSPHQGATSLIVSTLGEAEATVYVAAYSFTSKRISAALMKAHDRGVDVEIVMDASDKDSWEARSLSDSGIPVRLNDRYNIMHNKFMVIDNDTLELGSFNYTVAAENMNAENVLVIHHAGDTAKAYARQWRKLWDEARPFTDVVAAPAPPARAEQAAAPPAGQAEKE
jgi:phosphatidylserine/phosphatidylglycerophosphate/cardiolipin synthase-like enzyme